MKKKEIKIAIEKEIKNEYENILALYEFLGHCIKIKNWYAGRAFARVLINHMKLIERYETWQE